MSEDLNTVVLRPRFKLELSQDNEVVLNAFEAKKSTQKDFIVSRVDDHVFIKLPKVEQHFWSPQLHLEINKTDTNTSILYGLFGPSPTVWTLFIFLHFIVAGFFIIFSIWAYTSWALKSDFMWQIGGMLLMVIIWFILYFSGKVTKDSNIDEMNALHDFMNSTIEEVKV